MKNRIQWVLVLFLTVLAGFSYSAARADEEPVLPPGGGSSICQMDGASCGWDGDCCSGTCHAGVCGRFAPSCRPNGSACLNSSDCCNANCSAGICQESCRPYGSSCSTSSQCCSDNCSEFGTCQ